MSVYHLFPPDEPERNPPRRLLLAAVMIILFVSMVGGAFFWLGGSAFPLGPTPTVTATLGAPRTATPDFRSTRFAEDQQTAIAYYAKATLQTPISMNLPVINSPAQDTPTPPSSPLNTPDGTINNGQPTATQVGISPLEPTPTGAQISLPIVAPGNSPLATPTPLPPPIELPTATPPPVDVPSPTATQPPTPTPTPTTYFVASLRANIRPNANAPLRQAPLHSSVALGTLGANTALTLVGRDEHGEWVVDNNNRWLRQAYITVNGNQLSAGAPQGANPNDVRWLPTRAWPTNVTVTPPATPTVIPFDDFPTIRYGAANTARVPGTFRNNMVVDAFNSAQAAQGPAVPLIVVGPHVLLATNDGRVFSFDKNSTGNQLRNFALGPRVKFPPAAQDGTVYLVDEQNRITALDLNTDPPVVKWQSLVALPTNTGAAITAQTGVTIIGNRLYIAADSGPKRVVLQYNRETGQILNQKFEADGANFQPFAVGHQLLYVAGARLWALDFESLEMVWEKDLAAIVPPVYASNGIGALAELYVAATNNRIYSLDANTGQEIRNYDGNNEPVRGLALGNPQLYVAGSNYIKAYDRRTSNNTPLWRQTTYGELLSGPFASAGLALLITANGQVQFFDPNNGSLSNGPSAPAGAGAAIAGNLIFIPDGGGRIAKFREQ